MWVISQLAKELFASHKSHCCTNLNSYTKLHASTFHNLQKNYINSPPHDAVSQRAP